MPWPTDPVRRAIAIENFKAAQRARWDRNDGERERLRDKALAQWADPERRRKMAETKRRHYEERPEIRDKISATLTGRPVVYSQARIDATKVAKRRGKERKMARLCLIKTRAMLGCINESPPQQKA